MSPIESPYPREEGSQVLTARRREGSLYRREGPHPEREVPHRYHQKRESQVAIREKWGLSPCSHQMKERLAQRARKGSRLLDVRRARKWMAFLYFQPRVGGGRGFTECPRRWEEKGRSPYRQMTREWVRSYATRRDSDWGEKVANSPRETALKPLSTLLRITYVL